MTTVITPSKVPATADYRTILLSRKWWVLITAIIVVAAALYGTLRDEPIYLSETRILVQDPVSPQLGFTPQPEINLGTETQVASSTQVAQIAAEKLGGGDEVSAGELLPGLSAEASAEAIGNEPPEILIIGYTDSDPETAQRRSSAFAEAYLQFRYEQLAESRRASAATIGVEIRNTEENLSRAQEDIIGDQTTTTDTLAEARLNSLVTQLGLLRQQLAQLTPPAPDQVGFVLQPAYLPASPINRDLSRNGALGLFVGITLGIGTALLRERLDDHVRGRDDLERYSGTAVLGVIPRNRRWKRDPTELVALAEPTSPIADAYRGLRLAVSRATLQQGIKSWLVTSPLPQEGKTTTAANLGVAFAQTGKQVILVSADLQGLRLEQFFNVPQDGIGLTNVLAGELPVQEALARPLGLERARLLQNIRILPSGLIPGNPAELLSSPSMGELIAALEEYGDLIVVDAPALLAASHALALSQVVGAVLLVADAKRTSRTAVEQARRELGQVAANVIGAVLNNDDAARTTYARDGSGPDPKRQQLRRLDSQRRRTG